MREFLLELYLKYGEREFEYTGGAKWGAALWSKFLDDGPGLLTQLTPKGLEYIKNLDNP